jgi:hypothetical protein
MTSFCVYVCDHPDVIMMSPNEFISGPIFVSLASITCSQIALPAYLHLTALAAMAPSESFL